MKKLVDFLVIVLGCAVFCLILYLVLLPSELKPSTYKQAFEHFFKR